MLGFPDLGKGIGNIELAEADIFVGGDVELQVVAGGEGDLFGGVERLCLLYTSRCV